jgi:glycosyltransferase involved in cell wall biosynthesis
LSKNQQQLKIKKIAMLGSFPPLRGLSSYCLEIASALARLVDVEFISFKKLYPSFLYPGGDLRNDHTFPEHHVKGLRVRRRLTWYNPITWGVEAAFTKAELLHAQWWSWPLVAVYLCVCGIFKLRGKPVVFTIHNVSSHEGSRIYETVSKLLFRLGDHFIVHTENNRQQMTSCYEVSNDTISVIPHGSLDFQVHDQCDRNKLREGLGIASNQKVVLLFGAIRAYKGVITAIDAFPKVLKAVPDALLMIAGKLWQKWEPYQLRINELGIVNAVRTHLEYVPSGEVYRYFEAADLVILPYHRFDSQSGIGSTAVSFRKPMIVSEVGGLPDLVINQQYVVPPGNPEILARKIIDCLTDQKRLAAMAADAEKVAAEIRWLPIAQKTCAIYDSLLAAGK